MTRDPPLPELLTALRAFAAALPWRIDHCIAFGSRVRGDHLRASDLDVLLVSPDFAALRFVERIRAVQAWPWSGECALEVVCLTPDELARKLEYRGLVREAWEQGVRVETGQPNPRP